MGVFAVNAAKQLDKAVIGGNVSLEKRQELLKEQERLEKELEKERKRRADEEKRRALEAEKGRQAEIASVQQVTMAIEQGTMALVDGSGTVKDLVKGNIKAIAREAAAWVMRSIFANIAIPFPANVALAGLASGSIQGLVGKLASFDHGGRIREDDLVRLPGMPQGTGVIQAKIDELVLTPRQQQQVGQASAMGVPGGITFIFQSTFPMTQSQGRQVVQQIRRPLLELFENGQTRTR